MAKAVGLDAGEFEVKVVELDGSFKKPRLAKVSVDRVDPVVGGAGDEEHAAREAASALHALKDAQVARENVVFGFPSREAVLRQLTVPFTGADAIRKVIKFEAEGEIHSHAVDDMVVDFHEVEETPDGETRVLVAAVPKRSLGVTLSALERAGIEPEVVDLDTMALYRVADWLGCFSTEAAGADDDEDDAALPAVGNERSATMIVDVGARSTRVLAVVDGQLVDQRALRLGIDSVADDVADAAGVDLTTAREAVFSVLESGSDYVLAMDEDDDEPAHADGDAAEAQEDGGDADDLPARADSITSEAVHAARDRFLARLRRELMRFVTSLGNVSTVRAVYATGGGSGLTGIDDVIEEVFGCPPAQLDVLGRLSHNLDDEEARWLAPRLAVAVGLALHALGGSRIPGLNFRQEELSFTRRFDRVKFPLAIACMLAAFLPFIYGMKRYKELAFFEKQYGKLYSVEQKASGRRGKAKTEAVFWGYVGDLLNDKGRANCAQYMDDKQYEQLVRAVIEADTFDRLGLIRSRLQSYLRGEQAATGIYEQLQLSSGYYVLSYFSDVIRQLEQELGAFLITDLHVYLPDQVKSRHLTFTVAVRGENYRTRFERLEQVFREECEKPESPFLSLGQAQGERPFRDSEVPGAYYQIKLTLKEEFAQ